jgi:glutamate-5-semialdehyde dehydrogenase
MLNNIDNIKSALSSLISKDNDEIKNILLDVSITIRRNIDDIIMANQIDLNTFLKHHDNTNPRYDRLVLNKERLNEIIKEMNSIVNLEFDVNKNIIEDYIPDISKIHIRKISVPIGIIGVVYESRPNVTIDVFSLCFRSQNVCILKGGSESYNTNLYIVNLIKSVLKKYNLENAITLLGSDRDEIFNIIHNQGIDLCIARGGKDLINFVKQNTKIPFIETGAGVVHMYYDEFGDLEIAKKVLLNSKTRRVSVCNALDSLIIHKNKLSELYQLISIMEGHKVKIYADEICYNILQDRYKYLSKATDEHIGKEFLNYELFLKSTESNIDAINFINQNTSKHSEIIITEKEENKEMFSRLIDTAVIYINTSSAFTDGAQFGLGAEIGISTQKLHARGPMGINTLRTIKYVVDSNGLTRK